KAPPEEEPEVSVIPPEPAVETPPPSAGRMVRLRARLARSQSSLGQGLLNLLSSDTLDEDTWEEIEDHLGRDRGSPHHRRHRCHLRHTDRGEPAHPGESTRYPGLGGGPCPA